MQSSKFQHWIMNLAPRPEIPGMHWSSSKHPSNWCFLTKQWGGNYFYVYIHLQIYSSHLKLVHLTLRHFVQKKLNKLLLTRH